MSTAARRGARAGIVLGAALVLITINLRLAIGSVAPVLDDLRASLGMSATGAGLLTTAPVLCFGLFAPLAPRLARRFGQETLLLAALGAVVAGLAIRIVPAVAPVFAGTVVLGIGIAVGNVLMPSVIKRRFADPGVMMGLFTASLSVSAAIAAALTVPLEHALGSWRWALAAWAIPAVVAMALWLPDVRRSGTAATAGSGRPLRLGRDRMAWIVTAGFGLQSLLFYTLISWTPDVLRDAGFTSGAAGAWLSLAMLCGIPGSLVLPALMTRGVDQRALSLIAPLTWAAGLAGLMLDPAGATWLWMVLAGIGQGTGISYVMTLVVIRAPDGAHAAALSGMAQGVGYLLAAIGPFAIGAVRDLTGGWDAPIALLLAVTAMFTVTCVLGARDRLVRGIPPTGGSSPAPA